MRKMKKFFVAIVASALACVCMLFVGCSAKGTYKFEKMSIKYDGMSMSMGIGDEFEDTILTEDFVTLTLDKDGKATLRINFEDDDVEVMMGTWTEEKDEVYIDFDGDTIVCKKDGDTLTGKFEGATWTLKK